ncbi:uncharacterized protein LOC119376658 [Rhipicephalus sanguineus]|uniref:uncharacterized protein LOC119376658 n=1 Tax=Rhipicephalus sanguineus TaxID=34632 RepID=UPI001895BA55|nr:uncharacterized protein LOC119376658 [Rhipicephalus sanguineus]
MLGILALLLMCAFGGLSIFNKKPLCDPNFIAKRLGDNPDAWKLIAHPDLRYHLMFYSNGGLNKTLKCLCTTKSNPVYNDKWKRTVLYHYNENDTSLKHGGNSVWSKKTSGIFVYDNELSTHYYERIDTRLSFSYSQMTSNNQVIYTDKKTCILMKSEELGHQVWVHTDYLQRFQKIPYVCVFFYEACAGKEKFWAYDWVFCPQHGHCSRQDNVKT